MLCFNRDVSAEAALQARDLGLIDIGAFGDLVLGHTQEYPAPLEHATFFHESSMNLIRGYVK